VGVNALEVAFASCVHHLLLLLVRTLRLVSIPAKSLREQLSQGQTKHSAEIGE
jgi:hypothetical protein